jgi:hypothetical protein
MIFLLAGSLLLAQETGARASMKFTFNPESLKLEVGDSAKIAIKLVDKNGNPVKNEPFFVFAGGRRARRSVDVNPRRSDSSGTMVATVRAYRPGSFRLVARKIPRENDLQNERVFAMFPLEIPYPPLKKISFVSPRKKLYTGTIVKYSAQIFDQTNMEREDLKATLASSDPEVASLDEYGNLTAHKKGKVSLTATVENISRKIDITVTDNPVEKIELTGTMKEARTGDVIQFKAIARNAVGRVVDDAHIRYSFTAEPDMNLAPAASGLIEQDGRFVAEQPGLYTISANAGPHATQMTVKITPRNVRKKVEVVGHGLVKVYTSDLWVWEGVDGRDYAVTGTWGANGEAYFWDVTDPAKMHIIDTVTVDARTVNDVKVSEDGRICVISREGASNRKNGFVVLDVSNPREVKIISRYDDGLTGGVHNVFVDNNYVYAVNNGRRYDIINIEDPANPHRVGQFELDTPGHAIHDVWIEDGVAYSSNWSDGVQLVDIGGVTAGWPFRKLGDAASAEISQIRGGGSPSNPVQFAGYEYPSGWNHAAFPFKSRSTKKFFVLAGDEAFPYGLHVREKTPSVAAGWLHFIDFTDIKNPKETARYEVPEAGTHNLWVEDDVLYVAYYNGGLRVVDISGELMGDLYRQGREIASFKPMHNDAVIPNAPMVWGPQPYKGLIYFADMNSGLWAVKLVPLNSRRGTN